jgi:pimeloyl-ACP methyl ester carboxylesterase
MRALLTVLAILSLQGCALAGLREDLKDFYTAPARTLAQLIAADAPMQISPLDAPGFGEDYGRQGMWQPMRFLREVGGGLYLLEPYDAARVPVLFIHGAGGTPQHWRYFIDQLDREKYQAWVYYYPSGLPIDANARRLDKLVGDLHERFAFRQLIVTGHSMGGLVARRFLALNEGEYQTLLVTLATPWGGVPAAELGARLIDYPVPSWADLSPGSEFLHQLHAERLPGRVKHHLFFGYRADGDPFDSDGLITVASQLEGYREAGAELHGFKTDHSTILDDAAVFKRFAAVLAGFE